MNCPKHEVNHLKHEVDNKYKTVLSVLCFFFVFQSFGQFFFYWVIWFSIYLVLWIWSTAPARLRNALQSNGLTKQTQLTLTRVFQMYLRHAINYITDDVIHR